MKLAIPVLLAIAVLAAMALWSQNDGGPPVLGEQARRVPEPEPGGDGAIQVIVQGALTEHPPAPTERQVVESAPAPSDVSGPRPVEVVVLGFASGTPVEGARVREQGGRRRFDARAIARTDHRGRATVHVPPFGQLLVEAEGHGRRRLRFDHEVPERAQVTLLEHASLGGTVEGAGPQASVHVRAAATGAQHVDRWVPLAEGGRWRVADLAVPPERAQLAGIEVVLEDGVRTIVLADGLSLLPGEHRELASSVTGLLAFDLRFLYPDGEALGSPQRVLMHSDGSAARRASAEFETDEAGRALVDGLPAGRYRVVVCALEGGVLHRGRLDLLGGGETHDLVMHGFAPLLGQASLPSGEAPAGLVVRARRVDPGKDRKAPDQRSAACAPDGSFRFDMLPLGSRYAVRPVHEGRGLSPFVLEGPVPQAPPGGAPVELRLVRRGG